VVGDIDQLQCHKCIKNKKTLEKRKKKSHCDIVVGQCHNVTNHNITKCYPKNMWSFGMRNQLIAHSRDY